MFHHRGRKVYHRDSSGLNCDASPSYSINATGHTFELSIARGQVLQAPTLIVIRDA
jgi:hypothetical protein